MVSLRLVLFLGTQRLAPVRRKDDSPRRRPEVRSGIRPLVPLVPALMLSVNSQRCLDFYLDSSAGFLSLNQSQRCL